MGKDLKKEVIKKPIFIRDGKDNWRIQFPGEEFVKVVKVIRDRSSPLDLLSFKGKKISPFEWDTKVSLVPVNIGMILEGLEVVNGAPGKEEVRVAYKITGAGHNGLLGTTVIDGKRGITVSGITSFQKLLLEELLGK